MAYRAFENAVLLPVAATAFDYALVLALGALSGGEIQLDAQGVAEKIVITGGFVTLASAFGLSVRALMH